MDHHRARHTLERIHLKYLCTYLELQLPSDSTLDFGNFKPDLLAEAETGTCLFELKSSTYPKKQSGPRIRPESDFEWWKLDPEQIQRYEKYAASNRVELFWILLLGHTKVRVTDLETLIEESILHRDVYILPWDAYTLVKISAKGYRNLGLASIKRGYDLKEYKVEKGNLYVPSSIEETINGFLNGKLQEYKPSS